MKIEEAIVYVLGWSGLIREEDNRRGLLMRSSTSALRQPDFTKIKRPDLQNE